MYATTSTPGVRKHDDDLVVTVGFDGTAKGYDYFIKALHPPIEPGDRLLVKVNGVSKPTTARYVRASTAQDRLKRVLGRVGKRCPLEIGKKFHEQVEQLITTQKDHKTMGIKITNATYVNGVEIKDLSDSHVLELLREADEEIATLSALTPIPKRFQKKIDELRAGKEALLKLLDEVDDD